MFELFDINFSREGFKKLKLLSGFDMLNSEELLKDKSFKGKLKKYMYTVASFYFENIRKSYNESMKNLNHNLHVQINHEINQVNQKNRERMLLIYFNIFKALQTEISKLGMDAERLREIAEEGLAQKPHKKLSIDQNLESMLLDFKNIDQIMGLAVSSRFYLARKM
ncbi:MAG: hypothetical protein U5N58_02130 [Actinomycetota bacterium]|nr:hypothetical protein [Actinomycetota bacterium]